MPLPSSSAHDPNVIDDFLHLFIFLLISHPNLSILTIPQDGIHLLNLPVEYVSITIMFRWLQGDLEIHLTLSVWPTKKPKKHFRFCLHLHWRLPADNFFSILSFLFNAILISGCIPAPFKLGFIIRIPNGFNKDLSIPTNYRGITLLSVISKVFLLHHVRDQQDQLNPLQGGFRPGFSCLHIPFPMHSKI